MHYASHPFPSSNQQPASLKKRGLFDMIAISLIEGYYPLAWTKLIKEMERDPNEEV